MKFAYLIIAHNEPKIFASLVSLLDDERNDIFVHVDKKADISQFNTVKPAKSKLYFVERHAVYWGGQSQIVVELELLRAARAKQEYDYYHLLSGVDLPLKSQDYIHAFFAQHIGKEFVGITHSEFNMNDLRNKTRFYWIGMKYIRGNWFVRKIPSALVLVQRLLGMRRKYDVELAKGPQWFSITNALCEYLLAHSSEILRRFRYVCCPDEMFLQTEVVNSPFIRIIYDPNDQFRSCMRKIDWLRGSPYTWRSCDFEELVTSDRLFARKFSSADLGIVERIVDYVKKQTFSAG